MNAKRKSTISTIIMFLIFISVLTAFLGANGTGDRQYFCGWIENANNYGIIDGFDANHDMYPPLSPLILFLVFKVFQPVLNMDAALFAIRLSTAAFMIISCIVAKLLFKNNKICYILFFSTFLSVTNGYLDIFIVPFALISYYMAKRQNFFLLGVFLCLMCLMKYQPLIIMPIIITGLADFSFDNKKIHINIKWCTFIKLAAGAVIPLIIITIAYGKPFIWSIYVALFRDSNYISPNGLNVGWIVQYLYEIATDSLSNGQISIMWSVPFKALIAFKYVFIFGYIFIFFKSLFTKNLNIADILKNSLIVYVLYYLFNTNVHENHFFLGVLLAIILFVEEGGKTEAILIYSSYMFNINLIIFYGIWGGNFGFDRIICATYDPTILLAITNVFVGLFIIYSVYRQLPDTSNAL